MSVVSDPVFSLASDNYAPVHPEVLAAITAANQGHSRPYGDDAVTPAAVAAMRGELGANAEIAFVFNGTGANVVGLQLLLRPWQHVICARTAHIAVDECGAIERIVGAKLALVDTPEGKLTPELIRAAHVRIGDQHATQPGAVSISQSTEYGTVYSVPELREISEVVHELGMYLHLDGSRIANATAALGIPLSESTAGVDVLSFGGTKNGLLGAEAVVVFNPELHGQIPFVRKQFMQLGSKGRFLAAQFLALFTDQLWLRNASNANAMAARLHQGLAELPGFKITQARQANHVFAVVPAEIIEPLQQVSPFYVWDESIGEIRLLASWDTTAEQVDLFLATARELTAV